MTMIPKQKIEQIRSLTDKKERERTGLFVAEGEKLVFDLLRTSLELVELYLTDKGLRIFSIKKLPVSTMQLKDKEMERLSAFRNPSSALAVFKIPVVEPLTEYSFQGISLVLDHIQDPGNFGTIIRTADWFGISNVFCSTDCADIFNPKSVQSSMGAIARVKARYLDLTDLLSKAAGSGIPVFGTFMDGENIFEADLATQALIVLGNEGKGISPGLEDLLTRRISIPPFPAGKKELESLNVAVSASIICAEFRRRDKK
jgi:TrmH family RNA methyltransferase